MSDINNNETDEMDIEMIDITYEDGTSLVVLFVYLPI